MSGELERLTRAIEGMRGDLRALGEGARATGAGVEQIAGHAGEFAEASQLAGQGLQALGRSAPGMSQSIRSVGQGLGQAGTGFSQVAQAGSVFSAGTRKAIAVGTGVVGGTVLVVGLAWLFKPRKGRRG